MKFVIACLFAALPIPTLAESTGLFSFEQECVTNCPRDYVAGPASCVAIGHSRTGTCILTAGHNVQ